MLHDIGYESCINETKYLVSPEKMMLFLSKLSTLGYRNIGLDYFQHKQNLDNTYMITFDDAFEGVYNLAYPILKEMKIEFTIFINLSLLDTPNYLTNYQLVELSEDPLCHIGSHGMNHVHFCGMSSTELYYQYLSSKEKLEKIIKKEVYSFAFPYGTFSSCSIKNIRILGKTSYQLGFSTIPSRVLFFGFGANLFIPRINVTNDLISKMNY